MKLPNRYGTVTKLSGNRRKPWVVKEGLSGRQRPIGYTTTREEGLIMLAEYNKTPWDIDADKTTLGELYDLWLQKRAIKLGKSNLAGLKSAYKHCKKFEKNKYNQIKSYQMQDCIDNCGYGYSTQATIKTFGDISIGLQWSLILYRSVIRICLSPNLYRKQQKRSSLIRKFLSFGIMKIWNGLILFCSSFTQDSEFQR